jgi:hypothetical protein
MRRKVTSVTPSIMSQYLLTCACGSNVAVEVGQAGGKVVCPTCGAALDVPTLRKLRHLPVAAIEKPQTSSTWGARKGVATAGLILAAVFLCVALGSRLLEPEVPEFNPTDYKQTVDKHLEVMTPVQGFQRWIEFYRPLAETGFAVFNDAHKAGIEQYIAKKRFFQRTMLVTAIVCAAVAAIAAVWPAGGKARTG